MKRLFWLCFFVTIGMADAAERWKEVPIAGKQSGCEYLTLELKTANVKNAAGEAFASTARAIGMPWRVALGYIDAAGLWGSHILKHSFSGAWVWISHE